MKKKILLVSYWYPSDDRPLYGVFVEEQALALATEYDVAVLVPGMAAWRDVLKRDAPDRSRQEVRKELKVFREFALPSVPHGPEVLVYKTYARSAQTGYRKLLKEWGTPDLIHAHVVLPAGWAASELGRDNAIPVVLTEHSSPFSMHLKTDQQRKFVRRTLSQTDRIVAVSPSLRKQILDFEPALKVDVIGNLIRTDYFVPSNARGDNSGKVNFLSIAHLVEQKGYKYLLQAISLLVNRGITNFEVVIGGDGLERDSLKRLASELKIGNWCCFLGALDRDQARHWMQSCDVFVLPSLHETFGIVLGEAMSCGKPVIATRCGGPEFVVSNDSGCLVDVADTEALADAMSKFIDGRLTFDPDSVRSSVVNRFGIERFLRQTSEMYEQLWARP